MVSTCSENGLSLRLCFTQYIFDVCHLIGSSSLNFFCFLWAKRLNSLNSNFKHSSAIPDSLETYLAEDGKEHSRMQQLTKTCSKFRTDQTSYIFTECNRAHKSQIIKHKDRRVYLKWNQKCKFYLKLQLLFSDNLLSPSSPLHIIFYFKVFADTAMLQQSTSVSVFSHLQPLLVCVLQQMITLLFIAKGLDQKVDLVSNHPESGGVLIQIFLFALEYYSHKLYPLLF